jgi:SAM-dependent methyltransferase
MNQYAGSYARTADDAQATIAADLDDADLPQTVAEAGDSVPLPDYLRNTYSWAYLNPVSRAVFDQWFIVQAILWGNAGRLVRAVLDELEPGQRVLQTACVYGNFSNKLAEHLGPDGCLDVIDVAPIQVHHTRRKLQSLPQASVRLADAARPGGAGPYDAVCCFFLLHEVPKAYKTRIVDAVLNSLAPGGKAVFVDYHRPRPGHPLRLVMTSVFALLEPYAREIWEDEIEAYASEHDGYRWSKETFFGGLYQKVVVQRAPAP